MKRERMRDVKKKPLQILAAALCLAIVGGLTSCSPKAPVIILDDEEVVTRPASSATTTSPSETFGTDTSDMQGTGNTTGGTRRPTSGGTRTTSPGTTATTTQNTTTTTGTSTPEPAEPVKAEVRVVNGAPRLYINGEMTTGNLFFMNGDTLSTSADIYTSEIGYASAGGIHIYSTIYNVNYRMALDGSNTLKYNNLNRILDNILEADPQAKIMLRLSVYASPDLYDDGPAVFGDGSTSANVTMASDAWEEDTNERIRDLIAYIRSVPKYAASVYGYHLDNREWFPDYFTVGPDISESNSAKFREWLREKYGTDAALQAAWGSTSYTLSNATVPADLPVNSSADNYLLLDDTDQRFIDYNRYWSELTADRIESFAKTIKEATNNESIVVSFYGYYFEQYHATTGHWDFSSLLESPYLDGFASPTSYMDRNAGKSPANATSGFMTTADTVARAGKLWIMESDERTFINRTSQPQDTTIYPPLQTIDDIMSVHKREMGIAAIHSTTMYPMDLSGVGWYDAEEIWLNFGQLDQSLLQYISAQKSRSTFDVALVVDEKASAVVGSASGLSSQSLAQSMLNIYRAGVSFGLVELNDLLNGKADDYKVYIFVNPYALTSDEVNTLTNVLHKDNKTAVYMYSFGNLSAADAKKLTGMDITTTNTTASHSIRLTEQNKISGLETIGGCTGNPKVECGGYTTLLGTYSDGSAGFALYEGNGYNSIFLGSNQLSSDNIRALARYGGANIFSESDDVLVANQNMLIISANKNGSKTLNFDEAVDVYDYFTDTWYMDVTTVTLRGFIKGDTSWVFYGDREDIEAMNLPKWSEV